jgi:leucyl aminopeptidase
MTDAVKVGFVPFSAAARGILVVFCDETLQFGPATGKVLGAAVSLVRRAAETNQFKGKSGAVLDILAPEGLKAKRLIVMGLGKLAEIKDNDFLKIGGSAAGTLRAGKDAVTIVAELAAGAMKPDQAAAIASGLRLRAYTFDRYKTKKKEGEGGALWLRRERLSLPARISSRASSPRAILSMSRLTSCFLWNSPAAPANCASSASASKCSMSTL